MNQVVNHLETVWKTAGTLQKKKYLMVLVIGWTICQSHEVGGACPLNLCFENLCIVKNMKTVASLSLPVVLLHGDWAEPLLSEKNSRNLVGNLRNALECRMSHQMSEIVLLDDNKILTSCEIDETFNGQIQSYIPIKIEITKFLEGAMSHCAADPTSQLAAIMCCDRRLDTLMALSPQRPSCGGVSL